MNRVLLIFGQVSRRVLQTLKQIVTATDDTTENSLLQSLSASQWVYPLPLSDNLIYLPLSIYTYVYIYILVSVSSSVALSIIYIYILSTHSSI